MARARAFPLALAFALAACEAGLSQPGSSAAPSAPGRVSPEHASTSTSASAEPARSTPARKSGLSSPRELETASNAELTEAGFVALLRKDNTDESVNAPLRLLEKKGDDVVTTQLPFTGGRLIASQLGSKRFLFRETEGPKAKVRVWSEGALSEPVEDTVAGGAVSAKQAIALVGKIDRFQSVSRADLPRAHRYRDGGWSPLTLPAPAEKDFTGCFWDAESRPGTDEFILLQICGATSIQHAYALFKLDVVADNFERIPFDNTVFDQVLSFRGSFDIEADGTINLASHNPSAMHLARRRPGATAWKVITRKLPTRLVSSSGAWGDNVLMIDGGDASVESRDGGATFKDIPALSGIVTNCNRYGCALLGLRPQGSYLYAW